MVTTLLYNKGTASIAMESGVACFFMQNKDNRNNENKGVAGIMKKQGRNKKQDRKNKENKECYFLLLECLYETNDNQNVHVSCK